MAKFTYGPIVSDARNKLAGVVFSRSRSGPYGRSKVSPTQPRTSYQATVRANFTYLAKYWSSAAMDAYRAGWIALAQRYPVKDVFGNTRTLTGLQFFIKCNGVILQCGNPVQPIPPEDMIANSPGLLTMGANVGAGTITCTATLLTIPADIAMLWGAAPQNAGVARVGAKLRFLKWKYGGNITPGEAGQAYIAKFGIWAVGQRIFVALNYSHDSSGAVGTPSAGDVIST